PYTTLFRSRHRLVKLPLAATAEYGESSRAGKSPRWKKLRILLRLMSFLVYQFNEFFAEALVSTRNLEDLGIAFFVQSFFRKRPLHLGYCFVLDLLTLFGIFSFF